MAFRKKRAKLIGLMLLGRLRRAAPALCALVAMAVTAACGGSGGPNPGPGPTTISVTAVSPSTGTTFGGTTITITGTGFTAGATVQVGGTAATDVVVVSSTSITAKTPAHAAGVSEVRVSVGTVTGSLASAFTFVTPSVGVNTPPTVSPITVTPPLPKQPQLLATVGDRISLTASVNDAETPANQLTYEWTANPSLGTFSGTGAAVQWTAPAATTSPRIVLLLLTVIERYQEPDSTGLPIQREHRVQQAVTMRVHDSVKEIGDMARDFLTQFSISSVSPDHVMRNFSRTCDDGDGYREELSDVEKHRRDYTMLTYTIGSAAVSFAYGSTSTACAWPDAPGDACAKVPVVWNDRHNVTGVLNTVTGNDYVSAVYENERWLLCHSRFEATSSLRFHSLFSTMK